MCSRTGYIIIDNRNVLKRNINHDFHEITGAVISAIFTRIQFLPINSDLTNEFNTRTRHVHDVHVTFRWIHPDARFLRKR